MTTPDLPNISDLDSKQLLALREVVNVRLEEMRSTLVEQAQRLGLTVTNGEKKRRGRRPKDEVQE